MFGARSKVVPGLGSLNKRGLTVLDNKLGIINIHIRTVVKVKIPDTNRKIALTPTLSLQGKESTCISLSQYKA